MHLRAHRRRRHHRHPGRQTARSGASAGVVARLREVAGPLLLGALAGCGGGAPTEVTLAQLVAQQAAYDGRSVVAAGTLRTHPDPRHYWIEDSAHHRVALTGTQGLAERVGERVAVRGRFHYGAARGRRIAVDALTASP